MWICDIKNDAVATENVAKTDIYIYIYKVYHNMI